MRLKLTVAGGASTTVVVLTGSPEYALPAFDKASSAV